MVARSCNELIAVKITQSPVPEVARSLRILHDTVKDRDLRAHDCKTLVCDFGCRPCHLPGNILFLQV